MPVPAGGRPTTGLLSMMLSIFAFIVGGIACSRGREWQAAVGRQQAEKKCRAKSVTNDDQHTRPAKGWRAIGHRQRKRVGRGERESEKERVETAGCLPHRCTMESIDLYIRKIKSNTHTESDVDT